MKTRAEKKGGDWVLNGAKMWITSGSIADVAVVWAMTSRRARLPRREGHVGVYDAGHSAQVFAAGLGDQRAYSSIIAKCPSRAGWPNATRARSAVVVPDAGTLRHRLGGVGAAIACYREALNSAENRILFGAPLINNSTCRFGSPICCGGSRPAVARPATWAAQGQGEMHHTQVSLASGTTCGWDWTSRREARDILGAGWHQRGVAARSATCSTSKA